MIELCRTGAGRFLLAFIALMCIALYVLIIYIEARFRE